MCHVGATKPDKYGQFWTDYDKSRRFWTKHDTSLRSEIAGTVTAWPAWPASPSCRSFMVKIGSSGAKKRPSKNVNALKRPQEALHGPLPPFRDIYPWMANGFGKRPYFAMCHVGATKPDKYGQYWTNHDKSRQY